MKRNLILILTLLSLFFPECEKLDLKVDVPNCVRSIIRGRIVDGFRNKPVEVWRWDVDGKTYYYTVSDCCDQFNLLYDDQCHLVCAPDGGFSGQGDGKCPSFASQIIRTLVWKEESD
jgi:hypothetical protein